MATSTTLARARVRLEGALALLRESPALLPALAAVAVFVALGGSEAGFYPIGTRQHAGLGWYPAAVVLLALLAAAAIAAPPPRPVPRAVVAALALLAGYTVWSFLSITWAEQQAVAWDGANRTALYLLVLALFSLWPLTARAGRVVVGAFGLGIACLGLVELLKANAAAAPSEYFVDARFAEPAGYINANVALWTLALWPCLYLASARAAGPLLRALALSGAGILASLSLLGQSRGWALAVPVAALLFVALMPSRARALAAVAAVTAGTALVSGPLLAVHDEFSPERFDGLLGDATGRILVLAVSLALIGGLVALADRRIRLTPAQARRANRGAVAGLLLVLALAATVGLARVGDPIGGLSESWETFKGRNQTSPYKGSSRFASVGTNRYDFWVVAWDLFGDRPLTGIGSENFQQPYLARGRSGEQPRFPHSLELGVLSQTGLPGAALLGAALLAASFAALRARRRAAPEAAAVAGAAIAIFAYWLLHASVDWFWEFPGLTAPAFAMVGLAGAVARPVSASRLSTGPLSGPVSRLPRVVRIAAVAGMGLALALSLTLPWLAEREVERAARDWPVSPTAAFDRLERAQWLNPLSPKPHLVGATIAVRVEDQAKAVRELEVVLGLEPRTPFALAELAALASERGDSAAAERLLSRASEHAPRDEVVTDALERVRSGMLIDVRKLNADYLERARSLIGRD